MSDNTESVRIRLTNVRLSFPNLFERDKKYNRFGGNFLLTPDHPDLEKLRKAIKIAARNKWPKSWKKIYQQLEKQDRLCLHDGDTKEFEDYPGNFFVAASSTKTRPRMFLRDGRTELFEDQGEIYGGCYVVVSLEIWAQDNDFGKRVNAQLRGVQFYADGESFGGGGAASDDEFDDLGDPDADDDLGEFDDPDLDDDIDDLV